MAGDRILRKALLRAPLSQWAERIERLRVRIERENPDQPLMILYQTRLANLVRYNQISGAKAKKFVLREEVQIALCQVKYSKGARERKLPCVALDVGDEWSAEKAEMLYEAGIEYIKLPAVTESADAIGEIEHRLLTQWQTQVQYNNLQNTSLDSDEYGRTAYIQQRLLPLNLRYLPQQALSSILNVPDSIRSNVVERVRAYNSSVSDSIHRISEDLDLITTVDGVIVSPPPACVPVAIIEFDGSIHHEGESNPESKKKVEKDKIQNGILEKAKLPLIRVAEGTQVSRSSEVVGERVLAAFLGDIKRLMVDDEHQILAAQEMLYAEIDGLGDEVKKCNLASLLDQTITLLDDKTAITERRFAESIESVKSNLSEYDPYLDGFRHNDEPQWLLDGFTSEQESQEADFFQNYFHLLNENLLVRSFFKRTIKTSKHKNLGWQLNVEYAPTETEFPSVNAFIANSLTVEKFSTDSFVPLTVFGSDEFKSTLQVYVEKYLYPDVATFEKDLAGRLIEPISKGLGTLESDFWKKAFVNRLRKARDSKSAERCVEERVGLKRPSARLRKENEVESDISEAIKTRMFAQVDFCVEAILEARPSDYDNETIAIFRDELSEKIQKFISKLTFEKTGNDPKETLRHLTQ